ncbi:hypothetical protein P153DRAFT_359079 [Dothidotthia symphoricarpi CBS 119687]|uniref:Secreted protein n=1 Tax=Dothidotthia symphoricarpi CBS 119687 TaxID=1392245 RepID=A0A6A6A7T7_9PLEO|nr:uncharacterized protein P153DRAFT_359079 [Dothidotthia symphoricarpi CBS 119687]KAF2126721.1 hypothetical protein P153DRAFT_359079 [Dothidotthia symphoricarpi CBS 119687]
MERWGLLLFLFMIYKVMVCRSPIRFTSNEKDAMAVAVVFWDIAGYYFLQKKGTRSLFVEAGGSVNGCFWKRKRKSRFAKKWSGARAALFIFVEMGCNSDAQIILLETPSWPG